MGEIPWSILKSILHRWVQCLGCGWDRPLGSRNGPSAIGPQLFGSSAIVWYVMFPDSLNWTLLARFHGRYWYQSFIDGSNVWGVDRTDPWGPEIYHSSLGRSYLVAVPSYDMSYGLIHSLNWALWGRFHGRYWYQSFIDESNIWGVDSTHPWGPAMDHPPLGRSYLVVVPSYDMSCALILSTGLYGWDSKVDIDINPSSMGPIFGVWIGSTLGVPKWTIRHWVVAIW